MNSFEKSRLWSGAVGLVSGLSGLCQAVSLALWQRADMAGRPVPLLFDDAMVSMRYARNLALGHGWVWNPGDVPVEGFTNFGWVLVLAGWHLVVPDRVAAAWVVLWQGVALHGMLAALAGMVALRSFGLGAGLFAGVATGLCWPLAFWGVGGMETTLLAMAAVAFAGLAVESGPDARWPVTALAMTLAAVSCLVRMDGVVPVAAVVLALLLRRERPLRWVIATAGSVVVALTLVVAWRSAVFGQWTPNTYALKVEGFPAHLRVARGAIQTGWQVASGLLGPLVGIWFATRWLGERSAATGAWRESPLVLFAVAGLSCAAYSAYVGGDVWEGMVAINRFVAVGLPLLLVAAGGLLFQGTKSETRVVPILAGATMAAALSIMPARDWTGASMRALGVAPPADRAAHAKLIEAATVIDSTTPLGARIAVAHAGTVPYFVDRHYYDLLGKCDPVVARSPMRRKVMTNNPLLEFFPGHLKWDYVHSIGRLKPDYILSQWGRTKPEAVAHLRHYERIWGAADGMGLYRRIADDSPGQQDEISRR